jgi:uncharacterized protein DUF4013
VTSVGDGFAWPFQDPAWFGKILLQGLIAIIPIIGWIALAGWMMVTIDYYRAGRRELAPPGFHLARGAPFFLVIVVWAIVFDLPGGAMTSTGVRTSAPGLTALGDLLNFALQLLLAFLTPSIIVHTYERGLSGGFDVSAVWESATNNMNNSLIAGLVIIAAHVIGALGIVLCCVGLLFTIPYSVAITAGVATWYEQMMGGPRTAPPAGAT